MAELTGHPQLHKLHALFSKRAERPNGLLTSGHEYALDSHYRTEEQVIRRYSYSDSLDGKVEYCESTEASRITFELQHIDIRLQHHENLRLIHKKDSFPKTEILPLLKPGCNITNISIS